MSRLTLLLVVAAVACAQTPTIMAVVNGASYAQGSIAPGEFVTIYGNNLAAGMTLCVKPGDTSLPTSCGGVSVLINSAAAPLLLVSASQINVQVPFDITGSKATLQVTRQGGAQSAMVNLVVAPTAPGLFTQSNNGQGVGSFLNTSGALATASNPAQQGDALTIFGTGFGVTDPPVASGLLVLPNPVPTVKAAFSATVGGQNAQVFFAGLAPNQVGIVQVNLRVPQGLPSGNLPVVMTVGGVAANTVLLPVGTPQPAITQIYNTASGGAAIESGSWVSISGVNLSGTTRIWQTSDFNGNILPAKLDGVSVTINGKSAAVYYISPAQLNVQAPQDTATGPVQVTVTNQYGSTSGQTLLANYAPGFFQFAGNKYPAAVHPDGAYVAPVGYFGAASRPAQPGETILIFGTGFGPTNPATPAGQVVSGAPPLADLTQLKVTIGGVVATVAYAGITYVGEYQLNVVVPALPDGDRTIVASIGGASTQSGLSITIKN